MQPPLNLHTTAKRELNAKISELTRTTSIHSYIYRLARRLQDLLSQNTDTQHLIWLGTFTAAQQQYFVRRICDDCWVSKMWSVT